MLQRFGMGMERLLGHVIVETAKERKNPGKLAQNLDKSQGTLMETQSKENIDYFPPIK